MQAVREVQSHRIVHADLKLNNYRYMLVARREAFRVWLANPLPDEQTCLARPHGVIVQAQAVNTL